MISYKAVKENAIADGQTPGDVAADPDVVRQSQQDANRAWLAGLEKDGRLKSQGSPTGAKVLSPTPAVKTAPFEAATAEGPAPDAPGPAAERSASQAQVGNAATATATIAPAVESEATADAALHDEMAQAQQPRSALRAGPARSPAQPAAEAPKGNPAPRGKPPVLSMRDDVPPPSVAADASASETAMAPDVEGEQPAGVQGVGLGKAQGERDRSSEVVTRVDAKSLPVDIGIDGGVNLPDAADDTGLDTARSEVDPAESTASADHHAPLAVAEPEHADAGGNARAEEAVPELDAAPSVAKEPAASKRRGPKKAAPEGSTDLAARGSGRSEVAEQGRQMVPVVSSSTPPAPVTAADMASAEHDVLAAASNAQAVGPQDSLPCPERGSRATGLPNGYGEVAPSPRSLAVRDWATAPAASPLPSAGCTDGTDLEPEVSMVADEEPAWDIVKASSLKPVAQEWLWPGRIPMGEVTVVAGEPGVGKSQFAVLLAAHLSTGRTWPDGAGTAPLGSALMFAVEDNLRATLTPRLLAAGAAMDRVEVVQGVPEAGRESRTSFAKELRRELGRRPDVRLVVLDPYDAVLRGINVNDQRQMRGAMKSLQHVAAETGTAVLLIAHLNKRSSGPATSRVMGSQALVAAARSCILITKFDGGYAMVPHKQNLSNSTGLRFEVVPWTSGGLEASYIEFSPEPIDMSADELLGRTPKDGGPAIGEAIQFLLAALAGGPLPARMLNEQAAGQGISGRTLERARKLLGVQASRGRNSICALRTSEGGEPNSANSATHTLDGGLGGIGGFSSGIEIRAEEGAA
jgi:putative DNA primase/helicase